MKPTKFQVTVKDFSALSFGDIQIKTISSSESGASRPRLTPESVEDFNVHPDGPANTRSARNTGHGTCRALSPTPAAPKRARVLIVDDERNIRESLAKVLKAEGYEVRLADNGRQALACYEPEHTDIVLLDLNMPVQNGWDALDRMIKLNPQQAIIIITGRSLRSNWAGMTGMGVLIEKPIDMSELLNSMKRVLAEPVPERKRRVQIQHELTQLTRPLAWISNPVEAYRSGGLNE